MSSSRKRGSILIRRISLLRHYLTITVRHLRKDALHSLLNVLGLTLGLTGAILIGLYIHHEWRYDRHHEDADRIYRVLWPESARTGKPIAAALAEEMAEAEAGVLLIPTASAWLMRHEDRFFYEFRVFQVAGSLLDIFHFPLVKGDPATALSQPASVVLTETAAVKYFGDEDPIGKQIVADVDWGTLTVTGVMADPVEPSHILADMFIAPPSSQIDLSVYWGDREGHSYIRLAAGVDPEDAIAKIPQALGKYTPMLQPGRAFEQVRLQPVTDIHLFSKYSDETGVPGDASTLYLMAALALALLAIAIANFMNLTTACSLVRLKEIGVRKAAGARRRQLVIQFLGEAVVLSCLAGGLSVVLTALVLPWFNHVSGQAIALTVLGKDVVLTGLALLMMLTGLLAGSYPAFHMSGYAPLTTLRQLTGTGQSPGRLRQILVAGQFTMALILIIGASALSDQIDYLQNHRIGLQPDQVLMINDVGGGPIMEQFDTMRKALIQLPEVLDATRTTFMPGIAMGNHQLLSKPDGFEDGKVVKIIPITPGFVNTFGLELLIGETFVVPFSNPEDRGSKFILTRSAAMMMGWREPHEALGQEVQAFDKPGTVVGVAADFQLGSLRRPMEPVALRFWRNQNIGGGRPYVRIKTDNIPAALAHIEEVWREFLPDRPFDYIFLDEVFARMYRVERRLSRVSLALAAAAILIALLGVFGLTAYMAERRTKEMGIRKVLGASTSSLIRLLSREMLVLVLIANLAAWPLVYVLLQRWLAQFAYRIEVSPGLFILSGLTTLILAQLTVGYHAVKTARTNPAETLRNE